MHACCNQVALQQHLPAAALADRWLTPGAEYAVPEKLPLAREWYKDWEAAFSSDQAAAAGAPGAEAEQGGRAHVFTGVNIDSNSET